MIRVSSTRRSSNVHSGIDTFNLAKGKREMYKDSIFLLKKGEKLVEMKESLFDSEDLLQSLLEHHPELLAGKQMDEKSPRRWLLISRENPVPCDESGVGRWALDHLFLDQDGIPTLVEVKRSTDTRIRREVVGQLLDYAANAVLYWPVEDIRSRFEVRCEKEGLDSDEVLQEFLDTGADPDEFWMAVKTNLQAEKVRLVFVADEIPSELQRIIEFLNGQMDPAEVIGVQIKQYKGEHLTTLVPRVVGQTAEANIKKTRPPGRQWDEDSFFSDLAERSAPQECELARRILEWSSASGFEIKWGRGRTYGTFYPMVKSGAEIHRLFGVFSSGRIELIFKHLPAKIQDMKTTLFSRLNSIPGIELPEQVVDSWGNFPLSVLAKDDRLQQFLNVFESVAEQFRMRSPEGPE